MTLGSSLNLSLLTSQNISFAQVAAFGGLTKAISLLSSYVTRDVTHQKTVRLFSHIAGGALAYGVTRFLPLRIWIPNFPEPLSWQVAAATTFTIYLFSSGSTQAEKPSERSPKAKQVTDGNSEAGTPPVELQRHPKAAPDEKALVSEGKGLLAQLKADVKKLEGKLVEVDRQLALVASLKSSFEEKSTKGSSDALQKQLRDEETKNKSLADDETDLRKQLQANSNLIDKNETKLKFLEEEQKARRAEIAQLTKDLESANQAAASLVEKSTKASSQTAVEYLSSSNIADLQKQLREAEQKNQSLLDETAKLRTQLQASEQQLEQHLDKKQALLDQHSKALGVLSADLDENQRSYQRLQEELSSTLEQLQRSEDANAELQAEWQSSEKRLKGQFSQFEKEFALLEQKVITLTEELAQEHQKRAKAEAEVTTLRGELQVSVKSGVAATLSGDKAKDIPETPRSQPPAHVRSPSGSGMIVQRPIPAQKEAVKLETT